MVSEVFLRAPIVGRWPKRDETVSRRAGLREQETVPVHEIENSQRTVPRTRTPREIATGSDVPYAICRPSLMNGASIR